MQIVTRWKDIVFTKYGRMIIDFSIITFLTIIIFRNFIFSGGWPGGGDTLGWVAREYLFGHDFRWLYLWRPYAFGFLEGIHSTDFFFMLINLVYQSGAETVKAFMFLTFLSAGFSMYAFAYHYTHNNLGALSASFVYTLNGWLFTQYTEGHAEILFGYALAPLLFLLLDRALKHGRYKDMAIFAVVLSICLTGFNPLSAAIYMVFLTLFAIFYVLTPTSTPHFPKRLKRSLKVLLFSGGLLFLLSAFYIVPFVSNVRAPFYTTEFSHDFEESFVLRYESIPDAFVLGGVEKWGYVYVVDVTSEVSLQILPVPAILFGIFFIAYLTVFFKTDRYTLFFLFSGLASAFMAKGSLPPLGNIFTWAWFNVPYFSVFRAVNRFAMIIALCSAFFIAVLVSMLTNYISKRRDSQVDNNLFEINLKTSRPKDVIDKQEVYLSFKPLNKALKSVKNFLRHSSIVLLILILSSGFFSSWFFVQNGLQVYHPPEDFTSPYDWIANQSGNFKIVTAARSPSEWELLSDAKSDFGFSGMLTELGWGHDIGYESAFIHDKPVLQDGGWMSTSRDFVDHLRFRIVRDFLSDKLLKLLGTFSYKYVVLPPYSDESVKSFFLNQEGAEVVYNQNGSIIIENVFQKPRTFGASTHVLVVGGLKSLFALSKMASFNFSQTVPIFMNQIENSEMFQKILFNDSKAILFDDSDLLDLVMLSSEDMNVIPAAPYAKSSRNDTSYWVKASSWRQIGLLTLRGDTLTTYGNNRVSIPFEVEEDGNYEVMIRIGFTRDRGSLMIDVDSIPIERVHPSSDTWTTLRWINLGSLYLDKGKHEISLTNDGTGWNDVDAIAVVETSTLENQIKQVLNDLQNYPGRIIHILSGAHTFSHHIPPGWGLTPLPYQGYVLESNSPSTYLATNTTITREGQYMFAIRLAQGPNQGIPQLQVDNKTVTVRHLSSSPEAEWYEGGPVYLNASSYLIEVGASGKIVFDQMIVYSLEDEEKIVSLDDFRLYAEELGWNVSPKGTASASSVGVWDTTGLDANGANDENLQTRWASKPHEPMPQWLQIEWETPQELNGARIVFEQAYAEDYVIQTWNGTDWVNQVNVMENNMLDRLHMFPEPVKTTKLRISVTSVTKLYDLVSIWEIEAYAKPTVSRSVLIPEDGFYRVDFRLAFGPEYGTLNLKVNDETIVISCNSSDIEIRHYEVGPFYLNSGEKNVTVSAIGKVDFGDMAMTLNDGGDFGFLDNLFEAKPGPHVSYEEINPGKYEAHVEDSNGPFLLIFSESYHPLWKAYIDGEEISPIPVYSIVNGFYINRTGSFNVKIYFTGQTYADIGLKISMFTLIFVVAIIIVPSKKLEKWGNYIKQKIVR